MIKNLLLVILFIIVATTEIKAQKPVISYKTPQTLYFGKQITPITVTNTGGAVPARWAPQLNPLQTPFGYYFSYAAISSSGDIYAVMYNAIYHVKPDGTTTAFAGNQYGSKDGVGAAASFSDISGIVIDNAGNLYVAENDSYDSANSKIRKITPAGVVSTYLTDFNGLSTIAIDKNNVIYVSDRWSRILKIDVNKKISVLAGQKKIGKTDGTGANASFNRPASLTTDKSGNVYVADAGNNLIRKITPQGVVTTYAGSVYGNLDGIGTQARFQSIKSIICDSKGNLFLWDGADLFKQIDTKGYVKTIAKSPFYDNTGAVSFNNSIGQLGIDKNDNIFSVYGGICKLYTTGYNIQPALPQGIVFGANGSISGIPAEYSALTRYTVSATNADGVSSAIIDLKVVPPAEPPVIDSFSPTSGISGDNISINGKNFTGATKVTIGGKSATFYVANSTQMEAVAPQGITSGAITVTNPYGTVSRAGFTVLNPPKITSFSPTIGGRGTKVIIKGSNFTNVTNVNIAGLYTSPKVISSTEIDATINADVGYSSTDKVSVYTAGGMAEVAGFTFVDPPQVNDFSPYTAAAGSTVTITGNNFNGATSVKFGGVEAQSFTIQSSSVIKAVVGTGSSGMITITTPGGSSGYSSYFYYLPPPSIYAVYPMKGGIDTYVSIQGNNLSGTDVYFGGIKAVVAYNYGSYITAQVPVGAKSGDIEVKVNGSSAKISGFVVLPSPAITAFSPDTAAMGDTVTITGTHFENASLVSFGNVGANFSVIDSATIKAVVSSGASGNVSVVSAGGTATLGGFSHKGPSISSISPTTAGKGDIVIVNGTNFTNITGVSFGGVPATAFTVISPAKISAIVGTGSSGIVTVTNALGIGTIAGFNHPGPFITSFTPNYSGPASKVPISIYGSNFTGTTSVSFGGVSAASFKVVSSTLITAVPSNAVSGDVVVKTALGVATKPGFIWTAAPVISSISPSSQKMFGQVTISGSGFYGVDSVKFGGKSAVYFYTASPNTIVAQVYDGLSGDVSVWAAGGSAKIGGFVYSNPALSSVQPSSATAGQTIIINGSKLDSVKTVTFGYTTAAAFKIISSTQISVVLRSGYAGDISVSGPTGSATLSGFHYVFPPTIYSFSPQEGGKGTEVTINGSNLSQVTEVKVGGFAATILSASEYAVKVRLESGATGPVTVKNIAGTATGQSFTGYPAPKITSVTPLTGNSATLITINGINLSNFMSVSFGGVFAPAETITPTKITVRAAYGQSGDVKVVTLGGTATFGGFKFIPPPAIVSFTTLGEGAASNVTISGSNFTNVTGVAFGDVPAKSYKVLSANSITAIPGTGASGLIKVNTAGGTATIAGFLYHYPPKITSLSPLKGPVGSLLTITGDNFNLTATKNIVLLGQVKAAVKTASKTQLQVIVPPGGFGTVTVVNSDIKLEGSSNNTFQITNTFGKAAFTNRREIKFDTTVSSFRVDDFDGDGKPDLLVAKDDSLYILRNSSDKILTRTSFSQKIDLNINRAVYNMITGDINGDGKKDIIFNFSRSIGILLNTSQAGTISFSLTIIEKIGDYDQSIILRDIDMDGRPDMILGQMYTPMYYRNTTINNVPSFEPGIYFDSGGGGEMSTTITDIDGDGKPDPIMSTSYSGFEVYRNNTVPGSLFPENFVHTTIRHSGYYYTADKIAAADFDGDGKMDIFEDTFAQNVLLISRNKAVKGRIDASSFDQPKAFANGALNDGVALEDINGDGKVDLVSAYQNTIYVAANKSTIGNILMDSPAPVINEQYRPVNISFGDFDGDTRTDIATLNADQSKIVIYSNSPAAVPIISSVTPLIAGAGTRVVITGKYFDGTSVVTFGDKPAKSFTVISPEKIEAIVGNGATGKVKVQNPEGSALFSGFIFAEPPAISSFVSSKAASIITVTITGKNFTGTSAVGVSQVAAISYKVNSATSITATFKDGISGYLSVTTPGGTAIATIPIKTNQTITFTLPVIRTYGTADFVPAVASSTLPVNYVSSNPKVATIINGKVHIVAAGTVTITATQPGNATKYNAVSLAQVLTFNKAVLTVKADNKSKKTGAANPLLTATITGFVNGDKQSSLSIQPKLSTTAVTASKAGVYPITGSGAASNNYTFTYVAGSLTVSASATKAPNAIAWDENMQTPAVLITPPVVRQALSPNGDGINDVLLIDGIANYPDNKLIVMDKNGNLIYEMQGYDNINKPFDGHAQKTGIIQKAGTYFYVLDYKDKDGTKRQTGFVLIRY
ncbi:MAG: IPT/TIG domain-containing protein [Mucilaginibacter sp.]